MSEPFTWVADVLDHVGVNVGDLPGMAAWYGAALGLVVEFEFEVPEADFTGVMMRSAEGYRIELLHRAGNVAGLQAGSPVEAALTRGYGHFALDVTDVDSTYAELVAAAASVRMPPQPSPEAGVRMAYV